VTRTGAIEGAKPPQVLATSGHNGRCFAAACQQKLNKRHDNSTEFTAATDVIARAAELVSDAVWLVDWYQREQNVANQATSLAGKVIPSVFGVSIVASEPTDL